MKTNENSPEQATSQPAKPLDPMDLVARFNAEVPKVAPHEFRPSFVWVGKAHGELVRIELYVCGGISSYSVRMADSGRLLARIYFDPITGRAARSHGADEDYAAAVGYALELTPVEQRIKDDLWDEFPWGSIAYLHDPRTPEAIQRAVLKVENGAPTWAIDEKRAALSGTGEPKAA